MRTQDRRDIVMTFRTRLTSAMERAEVSKAGLARRVGIDRSTLSQLFSAENDRLPRIETLAAIAATLQVSLDWLLGLSAEERTGAAILQDSLQFSLTPPQSPTDENLRRWHQEAVGYKIRYVPTTLPDLAKTHATLTHEFQDYVAKTTEQAIQATQDKRAYSRLPDTDMEICASRQGIEEFALGNGIWRGLSLDARLEQLDEMAKLLDELYPKVRLFLFDGLRHYAAPYTIFGMQRAAVYVGQMYFVFTTKEHIRTLTNHFDDLIRAAVVQSHQAADFVAALRSRVSDGR